jgi:formylglycine-generating enzyme required for sulfatase activity
MAGRMGLALAITIFVLVASCSGDDDSIGSTPNESDAEAGSVPDADAAGEAGNVDGGPEAQADAPEGELDAAACPPDMAQVAAFCIDRYEAPNVAGALPLVMFTFDEAAAWCAARGKRLCFDDEWTTSCEGPAGTSYPYGDLHVPGVCNDEETWLPYDQSKLNGWPWSVSKPDITSLAELLDAARAVSASGKIAADHVQELYQGEASGSNLGCVGPDGVFDLCGNVEEWTRRRDGGDGPDFSGALKGRYWAESRTCQQAVKSHGNGFRFYEIGFRCCRDASGAE